MQSLNIMFGRRGVVLCSCLLVASLAVAPDKGGDQLGFNPGFGTVGISFGNSSRHDGLRFNWRDSDLELINGVNVTLWRAADELTGTVNAHF